jgi:hypothetical protein
MRLLFPLLVFFLSLASLTLAADTAPIRTGAVACANAMERGDFAAILDTSHPKVIQLGGGRENMLRQVQKAMGDMKQQGFIIHSITVGQPTEPVTANAQAFSTVPTTMKAGLPEIIVTSDSYLLAVSEDRGVTWSYIDGSILTPDLMKQLFPDAPANFQLPAKKAPKVEKKQ